MVANIKDIGKGSIIFMYTGTKYTPQALEQVILGLKKKGYELVLISQLIYIGEYTVDNEGRSLQNKIINVKTI